MFSSPLSPGHSEQPCSTETWICYNTNSHPVPETPDPNHTQPQILRTDHRHVGTSPTQNGSSHNTEEEPSPRQTLSTVRQATNVSETMRMGRGGRGVGSGGFQWDSHQNLGSKTLDWHRLKYPCERWYPLALIPLRQPQKHWHKAKKQGLTPA